MESVNLPNDDGRQDMKGTVHAHTWKNIGPKKKGGAPQF